MTKRPTTTARPEKGRVGQRGTRRPGVVLLMVVILMVVATMISVQMVRTMARDHRQMRLRQRHLQAVWLAESAVERATAQLRFHAQYTGETWTVSASQSGTDFAGTVVIRVSRVDGAERRRVVAVVADYPVRLPHRTRFEKRVVVDLPDSGGSS